VARAAADRVPVDDGARRAQFINGLELVGLETVVMTYRLEGNTPAGKLDMVRGGMAFCSHHNTETLC
jgi:hypothetical protein